MDRQVTSVFSEYQSLDNNSFNSKQLEFWLKQISSPEQSKTGFQWTFMSNTSSRYEPEEISFAKNYTVESNNNEQQFKENNSFLSNKHQLQSIKSKGQKNKSYLNAMIALQKKIKMLENQNEYLNKNLIKINEQRERSMSSSMAVEEQLKYKIEILAPRAEKIDELIEENKKMREMKEEKGRKLKISQKNLQQYKQRLLSLQNDYKRVQEQKINTEKMLATLESDKKNLQIEVTRLTEKNRQLQDMRDNSTATLLEKYNDSIETIEQYQKDIISLKNQIQYLKKAKRQEYQGLKEQSSKMTMKFEVQLEKIKENCGYKENLIRQKKLETQYFKEVYEKKDQEFLQLMKSQNQIHEKYQKQINKLRQQLEKAKKQKMTHQKQKYKRSRSLQRNNQSDKLSPMQGTVKEFEKQQSQLKQNKSQAINLPQTINAFEKQSFDGFQSNFESEEEDNDFDVDLKILPQVETKSQGKPYIPKPKLKNSALSSSSKINNNCKHNSLRKSSVIPTNNATPKYKPEEKNQEKQKFKQKSRQRSKQRSKQSQNQNIKSNKKSLQNRKSKNIEKNEIQNNKMEFQPQIIHKNQHRITFEAGEESQIKKEVVNSYLYSAPHSHWNQYDNQYEVRQFHDLSCPFPNTRRPHNFDQALLIELQKQLLDLYDEQQKLIQASNDDYVSQSQRSEFFGRLKQINQQLRAKNQKICQIKSRL